MRGAWGPWIGIMIGLVAGAPAAPGVEPARFLAGVARESITPTEPVWMAGYSARTGPSEGILTPLHARVLAIDDGTARLVIVTLDLIEIPVTLRDALLVMAADRHGLAPTEILLNVSHTHGGPMVSARTIAEWGIDPVWGRRAEAYVSFLVDRVSAAIGRALAGRAPATLAHGVGRATFAMNRRLPTPDGIRLAPNPEGPVDHDVPVLRVAAPDGALVAVVCGYACHNTALGPTRTLNGDYAGFALETLERDHPGAVALFLSGCGGDQDPSPRRDEADARANGAALAAAVESVLAGGPAVLAPNLAVSLETCPIPFAPLPSRTALEARAASPDGFVARHARWVLAEWPGPDDRPPDYPLPVQVVRFGDSLMLVALGGEPVVDYAARIGRELAAPGRAVWVAGYSNLVQAYVPNRRVLAEGGYEGTDAVIYQSLPGPFAPEIEERIVASVRKLAAALDPMPRLP